MFIENAKDFHTLLLTFGARTSPEGPLLVLRANSETNCYGNRTRIPYLAYEAGVFVGGKLMVATYKAIPPIPENLESLGFKHEKRQLALTTISKISCIETLVGLGVDEKELSRFERVKVTELKALIDTSDKESDGIEERKQRSEPQQHTFISGTGRPVTLIITKGTGQQLNYRLEIENESAWQQTEREIAELLNETKLKVLSGSGITE